ncbi:MAG TPA: hypothetical protein VM096_12295 [Vicinamibacterales bacterium]|nr:hypothetical protein [Vicinamibacterales bacterium]
MRRSFPVLVCTFVVSLASNAFAQVVNPATAQQKPESDQSTSGKLHTWEMPPITVEGKAPLFEEDLIGDYGQPRWTAHRRFGETRVYVIPKGMVEFEYWIRPTIGKDGKESKFRSLWEAEFGLPGRLQLDLYLVGNKTGKEGTFDIDTQQVELRYALADWGKIWGNPTLYGEWKQVSGGTDVAEGKLLLGGHIISGWHWGSNLVWEQEMGGVKERGLEWTTGWSYSAKDAKVGVGIETQLAFVSEMDGGTRTDAEKELFIGPSFQFRFLPQMHLDFAPLFGVTKDSPRAKVFVVFGWEM